jgi:hypothetical protein
MGISLSLIGNLRGIGQPTGASYSPDSGLPSAHQKAVVPELVRYLQNTYGISDLHVQGHFQHGKPACPGWDFEFWIMQREEQVRRSGQAFCWPVSLGDSDSPADNSLYLRAPADELARARTYLANTRSAGSGFYPFARQHLWHNGVHFFPAAGRRAGVFAVRDGWVIGARLNKSVNVDGRDYGSANFVLLMHEDPGLYDPLSSRTTADAGNKLPKRPTYHSLYMHLDPLDATPRYRWMDRFEECDAERFAQVTGAPEQAWHFASVAVPVKAGELIGHVGLHNAFAARDTAEASAHPEVFDEAHRRVLHFEMFAADNPVTWADPNDAVATRWSINDTDSDAFATSVLDKLDRIAGMPDDDVRALRDAGTEANRLDPNFRDPSIWIDQLTPALDNTLSKVMARHRSEWGANWNTVIDRHFRAWGLDLDGADHLKRVVAAFQWWGELVRTTGGYRVADTGLSANLRPTFFHPVRFLCWLNGLTRVLDRAPTGGIDADGYPICTNTEADFHNFHSTRSVIAAAHAGDTTIRISGTDDGRIEDSSIRLSSSPTAHAITAHTAVSGGFELTIDPALPADVARSRRVKLGNYGWHWEARFDWETDLT